MLEKGSLVEINNQVDVVVMLGDELPGDCHDHAGVWFGDLENGAPEVWTVPLDYLKKGPTPVLKH